MTTIEVIKNAIENNKKKLNDYYENENDLRSECCPEIEQIRTNILNLQVMYLRMTTGITDKEKLVDMASNM